jgi:hypothetical protein
MGDSIMILGCVQRVRCGFVFCVFVRIFLFLAQQLKVDGKRNVLVFGCGLGWLVVVLVVTSGGGLSVCEGLRWGVGVVYMVCIYGGFFSADPISLFKGGFFVCLCEKLF